MATTSPHTQLNSYVTATGERKSANMISAVSPGGQIHFDVFEGRMNAARFIEFCAKLVHDCPTPVFLIVDGSSAHTAKLVKQYVASTEGQLSLFLPAILLATAQSR
jgi:hypothetical protein